jgi:hypothetical protein
MPAALSIGQYIRAWLPGPARSPWFRWPQRTEDWRAIANLPFISALIGQARPRNSTSAQPQGIRGAKGIHNGTRCDLHCNR